MSAPGAIELRHLRYFLAVADTENFTHAARRLGVSQPGVSQQIRQLERALGTALFRRIDKRVQLTHAGAAFRKGAALVLRRLEEACGSVRDIAERLVGHVDLGVIPALHVAWVPAVLERMARDFPGITVGVAELSSSDIETELAAGRMDLGFALATRRAPGIRYERLFSEPFSLIVRADDPGARRRAVRAADLDGARLVLLPTSFDMRRAADDVFRAAGAHPRVVFEIDSIDSVLASVARTGTPTVLPAVSLRGREGLGLKAFALARTRQIDFGLLWSKAGGLGPAALAVAAALRDVLGAR